MSEEVDLEAADILDVMVGMLTKSGHLPNT